MAGVMRHTMVVRNPDTLEPVALLEGSELPDWATDLVHADNLTDGEADGEGEASYGSQKVADLQAEVDRRELEVEGTGKDGKVVKDDLVAALEADDADNA